MSSAASVPKARDPIDTLAALVRGFQYPIAHRTALAAASRLAPPVRGPAALSNGRIVSYTNDVFEALFDDEGRWFFDADCFKAPEASAQQHPSRSTDVTVHRKPLRRLKPTLPKRRSPSDAADPFGLLAGTHASLGWGDSVDTNAMVPPTDELASTSDVTSSTSQPLQQQQQQQRLRVVGLSRQSSRDSVRSDVPSLTASTSMTESDDDETCSFADQDKGEETIIELGDAALSSPILPACKSRTLSPIDLRDAAPIPPPAAVKRNIPRLPLKPLSFLPRSSADGRPAPVQLSTPAPAIMRADASESCNGTSLSSLRCSLSAPISKTSPAAPSARHLWRSTTRQRSQATLTLKPIETLTPYKLKRPRVIAHLPIRW